jgi:hypothetical protein
MLYLQTDEALQEAYINLSEGRDNLLSSFSDYLLVLRNKETGGEFAQVLTIDTENEQWTKVQIDTTDITATGDYIAFIYGQNSPSNTNKNDASVVGLVKTLIVNLANSTIFVERPTITIPPNVEI